MKSSLMNFMLWLGIRAIPKLSELKGDGVDVVV